MPVVRIECNLLWEKYMSWEFWLQCTLPQNSLAGLHAQRIVYRFQSLYSPIAHTWAGKPDCNELCCRLVFIRDFNIFALKTGIMCYTRIAKEFLLVKENISYLIILKSLLFTWKIKHSLFIAFLSFTNKTVSCVFKILKFQQYNRKNKIFFQEKKMKI